MTVEEVRGSLDLTDNGAIKNSIGHSALVMVAGTSVGFVQRISGNTRYNKAETVLKVIMGTAILLIGFYMFWLAF